MVFMFLWFVCNFVKNGYYLIDEFMFERVFNVLMFSDGLMCIFDFCVGEGVVIVEVVYVFGCDQVKVFVVEFDVEWVCYV